MKKQFNKFNFLILFILVLIIIQVPAFAQLGMNPDSEKEHTITDKDALFDLGLDYYNKEERRKGAHWIHIYEYSAEKGFINRENQPLLQYRDDAKVIIYPKNKLAVPFFDDKYPDANTLLNKYGFELDDNGYSVSYIGFKDDDRIKVDEEQSVETGLPIDIGIESDKTKIEMDDEEVSQTMEDETRPFWIGSYTASPNLYLKDLSEDYDDLFKQIRSFFDNYNLILNEDMTLTVQMDNQSIHGTIEEKQNGTIDLTFNGLILPETDNMEYKTSEPMNLTINVKPVEINDNTYFIMKANDKEIIFSTGERLYWSGTYEADVETYFNSLDINVSGQERQAMIDSLQETIGGHQIRLKTNYTLNTTLGGAMIGTITVNKDGSFNLNIVGEEKITINPTITEEEIYFTIPADDGEIKFVKID